jgi:hypothetical protein
MMGNKARDRERERFVERGREKHVEKENSVG